MNREERLKGIFDRWENDFSSVEEMHKDQTWLITELRQAWERESRLSNRLKSAEHKLREIGLIGDGIAKDWVDYKNCFYDAQNKARDHFEMYKDSIAKVSEMKEGEK